MTTQNLKTHIEKIVEKPLNMFVIDLPDLDKPPSRNSDWSVPLSTAYVVAKDLDCGPYSIIKADIIASSETEILEVVNKGSSQSYIDPAKKKIHVKIFYYGSEEMCKVYFMEMIEIDRSKKREKLFGVHGDTSATIDLVDNETKSRSCQEKDSKDQPTRHDSESNEANINSKFEILFEMLTQLDLKVTAIDENLRDLNLKTKDFPETSRQEESRISSQELVGQPDKLVESQLRSAFMKLLLKKRADREWRNEIKNAVLPGIEPNTSKRIKQLFIYGNYSVGSFMRNLAKSIFGEEVLKETLMGDDGSFLKGVKETDRNKIFTVEDELKLLKILKLIDSEFFTDRNVWKLLVRDKINQLGRDLKKDQPETQNVPRPRNKKDLRSPLIKITTFFPRKNRQNSFDETAPGPSNPEPDKISKETSIESFTLSSDPESD